MGWGRGRVGVWVGVGARVWYAWGWVGHVGAGRGVKGREGKGQGRKGRAGWAGRHFVMSCQCFIMYCDCIIALWHLF